MKSLLLGGGALACLALCGCLAAHNCYQIEMRPNGDGFHRELTCWRTGGGDKSPIRTVDQAELARIGKLYPRPPTSPDAAKRIFAGRFQGNTPSDVGGAGSYTRFTSSLGSASCYVERFRGNDDLEGLLARRRQAADRAVDAIIEWFSAEMGGDPRFRHAPARDQRLRGADDEQPHGAARRDRGPRRESTPAASWHTKPC